MDYYGLLFLYYLKGLSGKSVLRLFFNIEAGGTEQLLPENTSAPTTTPILADIQYPDGLRTDQYFTYRETPTTVSNKARIKTIKGNTLVWNQHCYSFFGLRSTLSSAINSQTDITCTASSGQTSFGIIIQHDTGFFDFIGGHTYLLSMNISEITANNFSRISPESALNPQTVARETGRYTTICNPTVSGPRSILCYLSGTTTTSDKFKFNSVQIIDLTMLNDSHVTDYDSFRTYYPLDYYSYNQGSLLSFMGNGIKTVGFNQWDEEWEVGAINSTTGENQASNSQIRSKNYTEILPNTTYYFHVGTPGGGSNWQSRFYDADFNYIGTGGTLYYNRTFVTPSNAKYLRFSMQNAYGTVYKNDICINISSNRDGEYEPYASSTLSLPISTYFPNGMNRTGRAYDELGESKAIKRTKIVNLGSIVNKSSILKYEQLGEGVGFYRINETPFSDRAFGTDSSGIKGLCSKYEWYGNTTTAGFANVPNKSFGFQSTVTWIFIRDDSYTTIDDFYASLQDVYLCYELAEYQETPITTEDANEALSLLMGRSVSSDNPKQMIDIITKGE